MSNHLLITGQNENELKPELTASSYSPPLANNNDETNRESSPSVDEIDLNGSMNISEASMEMLMANYKKLQNFSKSSDLDISLPFLVIPEEPVKNVTRSTSSTLRTRSNGPSSVPKKVPRMMEEKSVPIRLSPYNVKPGVKSKLYDTSSLYWKSNSSLIEKFDVKAIYHGYLGKLNIKCSQYGKINKGVIKPVDIEAAVKYATSRVDREIAAALADAKSGNIIASNIISADGRHLITGKLPAEISDYIDQEEAQYLEYVAKYLQER